MLFGNFFTVHDLLDQGISGEVIRFVFLQTHYRKPMDWTEKKAGEAEATLRKWRALTAGIEPAATAAAAVVSALADDLNTAGAISEMHKLAAQGDAAGLLASARLMGLLSEELGDWAQELDKSIFAEEIGEWMNLRAALKFQARELMKSGDNTTGGKLFALADQMRDEILPRFGFDVRDTKGGYEWDLKSSMKVVVIRSATGAITEDTVNQSREEHWSDTLERMRAERIVLQKQCDELVGKQ